MEADRTVVSNTVIIWLLKTVIIQEISSAIRKRRRGGGEGPSRGKCMDILKIEFPNCLHMHGAQEKEGIKNAEDPIETLRTS